MTIWRNHEYLFNQLGFINNKCIRIICKDQRPGKQVDFLYWNNNLPVPPYTSEILKETMKICNLHETSTFFVSF